MKSYIFPLMLSFSACMNGTSDPTLTPTPAYEGSYELVVGVVPIGNLPIPLSVEMTTRMENGEEIVTLASFRATGTAGVSDVLATVSEVPIGSDGSFEFDLGTYTLPSAYAPLGSDLDITMVISGSFRDDRSLCGEVSGEIVTVGLTLEGSTFGGVPSESDVDIVPYSCDPPAGDIPRIEAADCPTLSEGSNTGFPSAGDDRSFSLVLPADYDASNSYPLVFVYHGFGGTSDAFLTADLEAAIQDAGMIGVVPQGGDLGGAFGFDAVGIAANNKDLAMFDDLVTCVSDQFSVDDQRIHSTGMSNGGLFTGMLVANRSDVLASVAPLSGGITTIPPGGYGVPSLVTWGGTTDEAYEQDFHELSLNMIDTLVAQGAFVTACEHTLAHEYRDAWWPWIFSFLLDHPADIVDEPYADALPASFPEWCAIVE